MVCKGSLRGIRRGEVDSQINQLFLDSWINFGASTWIPDCSSGCQNGGRCLGLGRVFVFFIAVVNRCRALVISLVDVEQTRVQGKSIFLGDVEQIRVNGQIISLVVV